MERQEFLKISSVGVGGLSLKTFGNINNRDGNLYSFPQMIGGVTQTSAILQTRLASDNKMPDIDYDDIETIISQDIDGEFGVARFEVSDNKDFHNAKKSPWMRSKARQDFIIKYKLEELNPGTKYYMRVRLGFSKDQTHTGPLSQFKTMPPKDEKSSLSFVVSSCMNLGKFLLGKGDKSHEWTKPAKGKDRKLGYPTLEVIDKLRPNFWVQTGDSVYYDSPHVPHNNPVRAKTREQMRARWHRQMAMPRAVRLLQHVPAYWMVDDHDYRYNESDNRRNGKPPSPELARSVFREQVPVVEPPIHQGQDVYQTIKVNKLLQIWTLDCRFNKSNNTMPDGPGKTLWGKKQYQWLQQTLLNSNSVFKIVIMAGCMIGPDDAKKIDNHSNYGGFRYERDQFYYWLKEHGFLKKNLYFVNGDRHWQYHSIHPIGFEEFATGTLTTQNARFGREPGDPNSTDPLGLVTQPFIQTPPIGGFVRVRVEAPNKGSSAQLIFETIDERGNILYSNTKKAQ